MSSLGNVLKTEIARLARRELRSQVEPLKKQSAAQRRHIAALKRQVATLERLVSGLKKNNARTQRASPPPESEDAQNLRFSSKGLATLRSRIGFSAAEMGRLLGVSGQSVYNWEAKKSVPRRAQVAAIAQLRGVGKREALVRLEQIDAK
jgi:DNA-binding transcriptional regulator YiaG